MAFYWRLKSIPELRDMPPQSRREWWREAMAQTRTSIDRLLLALTIVGSVALARIVTRVFQWNALEGFTVTMVLAGALGYVLQASGQPRARRWLEANLKSGGMRRPWLSR